MQVRSVVAGHRGGASGAAGMEIGLNQFFPLLVMTWFYVREYSKSFSVPVSKNWSHNEGTVAKVSEECPNGEADVTLRYETQLCSYGGVHANGASPCRRRLAMGAVSANCAATHR